MITLRPDQQAAVDAITQVKRGIVKAPAGAGKTIIAAAAVKRFLKNKPKGGVFVWYAHTMEQCAQALSACQQFGLCGNFVCYQAGIKPGDGDRDVDLVICDECHHIAAPEFRKLLDGYDGPIWGFSATPEREDDLKEDVFEVIGPIVYTVERAGLVEEGKLLHARVFIHAPNDKDEMKGFVEGEAEKGFEKMKYSLDYVAKQIAEREDDAASWPAFRNKAKIELMSRARWHACQTYGIFGNEKRNTKIVALAEQHCVAANDSVLILVGSIDHGKELARRIPGAAVIYSKMGAKKRKQAIADFKSGKLKCAIATSLADEGLDVPRANVLILAPCGKNEGKVEQRTGRVLRAFAEQTHGIIHDFWDWQQPLLMNQSRVRARVYAELGYEFVGGSGVTQALKAIGIKIHSLLKDVSRSNGTSQPAKSATEAERGRVSSSSDGVRESTSGSRNSRESSTGEEKSVSPRRQLASTTDKAKARTNTVRGGQRVVDQDANSNLQNRAPNLQWGNTPPEGTINNGLVFKNGAWRGVEEKSEKTSCGVQRTHVSSAPTTPLNTESTVERKHARLSPSTLKSKAICPGFINDPDGDKTAANRGTLGHKAVEESNLDLCGDDAQLRAAVQKCIDYREEILRSMPGTPGGYVALKEIKFEYFEQWGFCDLIVLDRAFTAADLFDWKFAFNLYEADSPQFWAYCVGAWNAWPALETIKVHVPHPFLDEIDVETFSRKQHYADFLVRIKAVMARAELNRPEDYRVTAQCSYCGFAGKCTKLAALGAEIGRRYAPDLEIPKDINFHGSQVTDPATMAMLLRLAKPVKKAAEGWNKAGIEMYDQGKDIPGFKPVSKKGKRSVVDTAEVYDIIKTHFAKNMKPEEFLAHCTVTVTGLDELVRATVPRGSKDKAQAELAARLEDADALTFGSGSRYLIPDKAKDEETGDDE